MPRRAIEREFGVPIAGEILSQEYWTKTSIKILRDPPLQWAKIFDRIAPVVLDLGCGNGHFLIGSAVWRRDHDHLGIDVLPVVIRYATRRGNQRGLTNIRFSVAEARQFLERWVPSNSVSEIHCYHPQPYDNPSLAHRRLITPQFLALVHKALIPGGKFFIQSDHSGYWRYIRAIVPLFFEFQEQAGAWPDAPKGRTRREIIALRRGLSVYRAQAMARVNLSWDKCNQLAERLPQPIFDADPRLADLDKVEYGRAGR
jgi:tRNA (guanine-N7-)-methyltransferase